MLKPRVSFRLLKRRRPAVWMVIGGAFIVLDGISRIQTLIRVIEWIRTMSWPSHILSAVGLVFVIVGLAQYLASRHPAVSPLRIDHLVIESCSLSGSLAIEPGSTHRAALVDFLNDPAASNPTQIRNLTARLVYHDSMGLAYVNMDTGLWKPDSCLQQELWIGDSASLVIAVQDASGKACTVGFTPQKFDEPLRRFEAHLREGTNEVHVIVSRYVEQGERQNQKFRFRLIIGNDMRLERINDH